VATARLHLAADLDAVAGEQVVAGEVQGDVGLLPLGALLVVAPPVLSVVVRVGGAVAAPTVSAAARAATGTTYRMVI
jgi:hypothetical protein